MAQWESIDAFLNGRGIRIGAPSFGQTTGGIHSPDSLHYQGRARDYGDATSDVTAVYAALEPFAIGENYVIEELFFKSMAWDGGRRVAAEPGHNNHVHAALKTGATLGGAAPVGSPSAGGSKIADSLAVLTSHEIGTRVAKVGIGVVALIVGITGVA